MSIVLVWHLVLLVVLYSGLASNGVTTDVSNSTIPSVIHVGAILSLETLTSKVAEVAMKAAIEDVNADPSVLVGAKLEIRVQDSNYSGFLGIVEGMSCFLACSHRIFFFKC